MGLWEAGFAIWTMDGSIRRHTGSGESHRALQLYLGQIWPFQQRDKERDITSQVFNSLWPDMEGKKYGLCCSKKSEKKNLLRLFKGIFFLKYIFYSTYSKVYFEGFSSYSIFSWRPHKKPQNQNSPAALLIFQPSCSYFTQTLSQDTFPAQFWVLPFGWPGRDTQPWQWWQFVSLSLTNCFSFPLLN